MLRFVALLFASSLIALAASAQDAGRFYGTADGHILNPDGEPVILKGVGLGGWLVPEGYMLHISAPDGGSPTSIRAQIEDLIGVEAANTFDQLYRDNYVAQKDIQAIAEWGYDHIRLPFHYKDLWDPETEQFRESGFELFDTFLEWCREAEIEVVLDMHAAPGAQNEGNISDSDGVARLWTEPDPYQDWTVTIWEEIARRYASDTLIIGYDLINEPVLPQSVPSSDLRDLYVRITDAIRAVDTNHILFIEGNYYATDFGAIETPWDDNMVYAFHKYWNAPDQGSIQYLIDLRDRTGVPLWLGETGENSNPWFFATRTLAERNGISWNWWTHKKIETTNAPASAPFAPGYEAVLEYWRGTGSRPTSEAARNALFAMARSLDLDENVRNVGVLEALFDDDFGSVTKPYRDHQIPGSVHAVHYDIGNQGVAYSDTNPWATSGTPGSGNTGGAYRNDGVDIERSTDAQGYAYNVGWTESGEQLRYTVTVASSGTYDVEFRVASGASGGLFTVSMGQQSLGRVTAPGTGGWQNWRSVWLRGVELTAGEQVLQLSVRSGGFNLNTMRFVEVEPTNAEAEPNEAASRVSVFPNPTLGPATVQVELVMPSEVSVRVFDALGRRVSAQPTQMTPAGIHELAMPSGLAPGVYSVQVVVGQGETARHYDRVLTVSR